MVGDGAGPAAVVVAVRVVLVAAVHPELRAAAAVEVQCPPGADEPHQLRELEAAHAGVRRRTPIDNDEQQRAAVFAHAHGGARVAIGHVGAIGEARRHRAVGATMDDAFVHELGKAADERRRVARHGVGQCVGHEAFLDAVGAEAVFDVLRVVVLDEAVAKRDPPEAAVVPLVGIGGVGAGVDRRPHVAAADGVAVDAQRAGLEEVGVDSDLRTNTARPAAHGLGRRRRPGCVDVDAGGAQVDLDDVGVRRWACDPQLLYRHARHARRRDVGGRADPHRARRRGRQRDGDEQDGGQAQT